MYPRENSFTRRQANYAPNNQKYPPQQDMRYPDESPVAVRQTRRQGFEGTNDYYDPHTPPRHEYGPPSRSRDPRYDMHHASFGPRSYPPQPQGQHPHQHAPHQSQQQHPRYHPGPDYRYGPPDPRDPRYNPDPRANPSRNFGPGAPSPMYGGPHGPPPPYADADYPPHMPFQDARGRWGDDHHKPGNGVTPPPGVPNAGPGSGGGGGRDSAKAGSGSRKVGSDGTNASSGGAMGADKGAGPGAKPGKADRRKKLDPKTFALSMELLGHAGNGRLDMCQTKIANGANADFADYDKRTPLHVASANGHVLVVKLLLDCGANPDVEDRWGSKPVDDAKKNGHKEIMDLLRDHGGDHEDTLHKEQHDGLELLEYCSKGLMKDVRDKIRAGTKATFSSYDRRTPLHLACCEGHIDLVQLLLQNGADATYHDRFGRSPVDDALSNGHVDVLRLLASKGIAVPEHILDEDHTPEFQRNMHLIDFAAKGKAGAALRCLHEGADVNFCDYDKRTALHLACSEGHAKVVTLLLNEGADPTIEDRFACTTMEVASQAGYAHIEEMIREHMKNKAKKSG